jgi:hypothetical protein
MLISEFREPVRFYLGDHDDSYRVYEDTAIDRGVRTIVKCGLVPGYAVSANNLEVTPEVAAGKDYLLLTARVALGFAAGGEERSSVRTRAWAESRGGFKPLVEQLERLIEEVRMGVGFVGFQNYQTFIEGYSGMGRRTWGFMTRMEYQGPIAEVSYSVDGGFQG